MDEMKEVPIQEDVIPTSSTNEQPNLSEALDSRIRFGEMNQRSRRSFGSLRTALFNSRRKLSGRR